MGNQQLEHRLVAVISLVLACMLVFNTAQPASGQTITFNDTCWGQRVINAPNPTYDQLDLCWNVQELAAGVRYDVILLVHMFERANPDTGEPMYGPGTPMQTRTNITEGDDCTDPPIYMVDPNIQILGKYKVTAVLVEVPPAGFPLTTHDSDTVEIDVFAN